MTWKREISIGNVLSALTMLVVAVLFVTSIRSTSQMEMSELRGEMKTYSSRLDAVGQDFKEFKSSTQQANVEVRQKLDSLSAVIADMRVLIAGDKKR